MKVIDDGIIRDSTDVIAADRLIKMKTTHDVWEVIAECIRIWSSKHPTTWDSYLVDLSDMKRTRKNRYASTTDKVTGGMIRYIADIPYPLYKMIRSLYSASELPMTKEFFLKFAKKFPVFQIAEKL